MAEFNARDVNAPVIDVEDRTLWKEIRRAVDMIAVNNERVIEIEKAGKLIKVRYMEEGTKAVWGNDSISITIADVPVEPVSLILPP